MKNRLAAESGRAQLTKSDHQHVASFRQRVLDRKPVISHCDALDGSNDTRCDGALSLLPLLLPLAMLPEAAPYPTPGAPAGKFVRQPRTLPSVTSYDQLLPLDVPTSLEMEYAPVLGLHGKLMSRIVFGTLFLSKADDPCALLDAVRQTGCNAFDCAAVYGGGECERLLGVWMRERKVPREEVVLITKGGCGGQDKLWAADLHPDNVRSDLINSLTKMGVSYVDLYLLHRDQPSRPIPEIVDMMHTLQQEGRYTAWGVSNWDLSRLREAIAYARANGKAGPVCDSPQISLAVPTRPVWPDTKFADREALEFYAESGVSVLAWEVLGKGFMTGKWDRADAEKAEALHAKIAADPEFARSFGPTGKLAAEWREHQLTTAYCTEENFKRRERVAELAASKGLTMAQVALQYVASLPFNAFVQVGTTSAKHFGENSVGGSIHKLSKEEVRWLETGSDGFVRDGPKLACSRPGKRKQQSPEEFVPPF